VGANYNDAMTYCWPQVVDYGKGGKAYGWPYENLRFLNRRLRRSTVELMLRRKAFSCWAAVTAFSELNAMQLPSLATI